MTLEEGARWLDGIGRVTAAARVAAPSCSKGTVRPAVGGLHKRFTRAEPVWASLPEARGPARRGQPGHDGLAAPAWGEGARWAVDPSVSREAASGTAAPGRGRSLPSRRLERRLPGRSKRPFLWRKTVSFPGLGRVGRRWTFDQNTATEDQCQGAGLPPEWEHARVRGERWVRSLPQLTSDPFLRPLRARALRLDPRLDTNTRS